MTKDWIKYTLQNDGKYADLIVLNVQGMISIMISLKMLLQLRLLEHLLKNENPREHSRTTINRQMIRKWNTIFAYNI